MPDSHRASGPFEVTMSPQPAVEGQPPLPGITLARVLLDKSYHGDLQASAQGQMLSAVTGTPGSAAYVAIEQVSGSLHGRSGSFVLQHSGLMERGARQLSVSVVPDSGSGELTGLRGTLDIRITADGHFHDFDYSLP